MNLYACPMPGEFASPFVASLKADSNALAPWFTLVDDADRADVILPDVDLDAFYDPDHPEALPEYLHAQPLLNDPAYTDKVVVPTALPDFPDCPPFRVLSFAPGADLTWFGPVVPVRREQRHIPYGIKKPDRFCSTWQRMLTHLSVCGATRYVDPAHILTHPELVHDALAATRYYLAPPPACGGLTEHLLFFAALASGCMPIVLGNGPLPGETRLDYGDVVWRVIRDVSSACTIRNLADSASAAEEQRRAQTAHRFFERHFSISAVAPRLYDALGTSAATTVHTPQPCRARVIDLDTFFYMLWQRIASRHGPGARMAIYGCGRMLKQLLAELLAVQNAPALVCMLDDAPKAKAFKINTYMGVPIIKPEQAPHLDLIFIGSDFYEQRIREQAMAKFSDAVMVLGVTDFFTPLGIDSADYWSFERPRKYEEDNWTRCGAELSDDADRKLANILSRDAVPPERIRKLEGMLVCVEYSDFLQWTLPLNLEHFDTFVVVTSSRDKATQDIANECGAELVVSDAYLEGGATFNKGRMMNAGLRHLDGDGWLLFTDADIIFPPNLRADLERLSLDRDTLYFAHRFNIPDYDREAWLRRYHETRAGLEQVHYLDNGPFGYFQLFSPRAEPIAGKFPLLCNENFYNAGGIDLHFSRIWHKHPCCALARLGVRVLHIPHGSLGDNWASRRSPLVSDQAAVFSPEVENEQSWIQVAYLIRTGVVELRPMPDGGYIKFIRCDTGECIIVENNKAFPRWVSGHDETGWPMCGICSGRDGDVVLLQDARQGPMSGWGIGVLRGMNRHRCVWNNRQVYFTDFDVLHKPGLNPEDQAFVVPAL